MNAVSRKVEWAVWGGLCLVIFTIAALYVGTRWVSPPPPPAHYPEIPEFTLTNQMGSSISRASLHGQVWVADIIFTTCPGPCAQMTKRMSELQAALSADAPVKLVSLTTYPEFDTPAVLAKYAARFGAQSNRWWFLTGTKQQIFRLAIDGLKLTALDKDPAERSNESDLFIHSTIFVVVDKQGRFRGAFEALQPGPYREMLSTIKKLQRERNR